MTYASNNARARLERAMELVEEAQNKLAEAAQELSPIVGLVPQWTAAGGLHRKVKSFWYRLETVLQRRGDQLKLDANAQRFYDERQKLGPSAPTPEQAEQHLEEQLKGVDAMRAAARKAGLLP